jgi:biotin operon repressor
MKFVRDYIKKKISTHLVPVRVGFSNVAKDIESLQQHVGHLHGHTSQWHDYLHRKSAELEKSIKEMARDQDASTTKKVRKALESLERDIGELRENIEESQEGKRVFDDMSRLKSHLKHIFGQYNGYIVKLHKRLEEVEEAHISLLEKIDERVEKRLKSFLSSERESESATKKQPEPAKRRAEISQPSTVSPAPTSLARLAARLTPAQKTVLAILATADQDLSYKDLAVQYGKSPSTVKSILCELRRAGVPIDEGHTDGIKRFRLPEHFKKIVLSRRL